MLQQHHLDLRGVEIDVSKYGRGIQYIHFKVKDFISCFSLYSLIILKDIILNTFLRFHFKYKIY